MTNLYRIGQINANCKEADMEKMTIVRAGMAKGLHVLGGEVRFLCRSEDTGGAWSLMETVIPKDAGPPPHHHAWAEAYYVIEGALDFTIDGQPLRVEAGDFAHAPGGVVHGFKGATDAPARMLIFDAPAHAAGFFEAVDREVNSPEDLQKVPEIGARNGIHFVAA
jgi:quercetin dioxygenase-like cupin family protein